jgi:hypothetical protein
MVTVACVALFVARLTIWDHGAEASVLYRVQRIKPSLLDEQSYDSAEFALFSRTQAELLRSEVVLQAALRQPGVSGLAILAGRKDPAGWLAEQLEVRMAEGSELLTVRLWGDAKRAKDLQILLGAVQDAYVDVFINSERERRITTLENLRSIQLEVEDKLRRVLEHHAELTAAGKHSHVSERLTQMEADSLSELWRDVVRRKERLSVEIGAPSRVVLMRPPTVRTW